jgi:hypothetical protein
MPVDASHRPLTIPRRTSQAAKYCRAPPALVLVLDTLRAPRRRWQAGTAPDAGLDTGLFIGADDVILGAKRCSLPVASIQIQYAPGFFRTGGVAGKNPILVLPGFDGIGIAYPPDRAGTDRLAQRPTRLCGNVRRREPTQGQGSVVDRLTRDSFDAGLVISRYSSLAGRFVPFSARVP